MAAQVVVPIFPLPDLTFFPRTILPLHVFEARYRAMVTDCLSRDRRLAVVGLKPGYESSYEGKPEVYPITGVGRIVRWERLATGRFNLLVRGECRARIDREVPADTLYRMVAATPLGEHGGDGPEVAGLAGRVKARCRQILDAVGRGGAELRESLEGLADPAELCDQVASALVPAPAVRQALLEELHVERRLERLVGALDDLLSQLPGDGGRA
ncbi:MAG TPA: LON peptidase substrate-binding domain-containing protein [Candidatus Bathyarchaeia archaeon]|nr:LON peptidase substrate-binding domain-containing protein [Candidatus Bathyarchaeia archaeon]